MTTARETKKIAALAVPLALLLATLLFAGCLDDITTMTAEQAASEIASHVKTVYADLGTTSTFNLSIAGNTADSIEYIRTGDRLNPANESHGYDARSLIEWEVDSQPGSLEVKGNDLKPVIMTSASAADAALLVSGAMGNITPRNSSWSKQLEIYAGDYTVNVHSFTWDKNGTDNASTYSDKFVLVWLS